MYLGEFILNCKGSEREETTLSIDLRVSRIIMIGERVVLPK